MAMWYLLFIFVALFFSFALHSVATQGGNSSVLELFSSYVYKIVVIIFKLQFLLSGEIVQKRARSGAKGGERKSIIVSVCTNGLGHAAQCIRVLEVLKKEAIVVEAIVIAKRSKLPEYMNDYFSSYGAEVLDLDIEVDYDSGITINNVKVMVNFVTTLLFHGASGNRKMCKTINTFQPHVLLNFWEPFAATFINANNEYNTKIITLASQGTYGIGPCLFLSATTDGRTQRRQTYLEWLWYQREETCNSEHNYNLSLTTIKVCVIKFMYETTQVCGIKIDF